MTDSSQAIGRVHDVTTNAALPLRRIVAADRVFWLVFGLGLALRIGFACLPLNVHLLLLEDDAWMVTAIARNLALGHGISADGVHPTNGFHPLYPLVLGVLPYLLRPNDLDFGFAANLLICALLNSLIVLPLYGLLRRFAPRRESLLALLIFALNPYLVRLSVNAMETSLALLMLVTLVYAFYTLDLTRLRTAIILGALAALATLARLDLALMGAVLGAFWLYNAFTRHRSSVILPFVYAFVAALLLIPYFVRNWLVFGSLSPSSGRALAYMHSYAESFALTSGTQIVAYNSLINLSFVDSSLVAALVIVGAIGLGLWLIPRAIVWKLAPIWLFIIIQTVYYAYLQQQGQPRYYVGASTLLLVPVAVGCSRLRTENREPRTENREPRTKVRAGLVGMVGRYGVPVVIGLVVALNCLEPIGFYVRQRDADSSQPAMYQASRWIAANLPPAVVLAARNSGIYQYYSQHLVINIDGKLNHEIVPVLEERGLMDYLRTERVGYVVDLQQVCGYIEFYSHQYSDAPAHHELSSVDKLRIYGTMALRKLGIGAGPQLDAPVPDTCRGTFTTDAPVLESFPVRPNSSTAVTIFRIR